MKNNKGKTMNYNTRSKTKRNTSSLRKKGGVVISKAYSSRRSTITKPNVSFTAKNNKKLRDVSSLRQKTPDSVSLSRSMSLVDEFHSDSNQTLPGASHPSELVVVKQSFSDQNIHDTGERRRSSRFTDEDLVETFALGDESTRNDIPDDTIKQFIQTYIKVDKPVVISLPVSPQRHAFLVYVKTIDENKIMIADWYLRKYQKKVGYQKDKAWKTYNRFMELLQETYPNYIMEFFPIDKYIKKDAKIYHKKNKNSLGCSFYIYEWIKQHRTKLL